jgi:hypothetical protein
MVGYQTRMVAPGLWLTVPDYIVPINAKGVDSIATTLSGGGFTILVDEGPFSDPVTRYADQPAYEVSTESIKGHPARIVYFEDEEGVRHLAARLEIEGQAGAPRGITIVIHVFPDRDITIARKVLESASFQP